MSKYNKIHLESIRKLPERFVDEETHVAVISEESVIVANPKYAPMIYHLASKRWVRLDKETWKP